MRDDDRQLNTSITVQEIHEVPDAIRATLTATRPAAAEAAGRIAQRKSRRVFLIGNGTSFYSAVAAAYTARRFHTGDAPEVLAVPAGDFRHFPPALRADDVVVGISASGEFRDVIHIFEQLQGRCLLIGITHVPGSTLVGLSDVCLVSAGGASRVPIMTKTYASTLTAAHLLMLELSGAPAQGFEELRQSAERSGRALARAEEHMAEIARLATAYDHAFVYGAGPGYAAALEGALKLKETSLIHAEASETWEMASGPVTIVGGSSLLVPIYTGGIGDEATGDFTRTAGAWGPAVLELGLEAPGAETAAAAPADVMRCFSSLEIVPCIARLACAVAMIRGVDPDAPTWRERYIVQGMTHAAGR